MITLNLPELVETGFTDIDGWYTIFVKATTSPLPCCLLPPVKNGTKPAGYRDMNMHGRHVTIRLARQKFLCRICGRSSFQPVPHMDDGHMMTERLVAYLIKRSMETTFKGLERELDLEETVIRRIFRAYAKEQLEALRIETPEYMGLDELHILSKFRGVVTNVALGTMVEMLPNRDQKTIIAYLSGLKDREKIKAVTIDMWHPYRRAINLVLPGVPIVVDKFHIIRMAYDAVERVRKAHRASLTPKERLRLKDDRWILNRPQERLRADQVMILESWVERFPVLKEVYEAREGFAAVWKAQTSAEAKALYDQWRINLPDRCEAAFHDLRLAMHNWREEIFNYFDIRITNSATEARNGIARVVNRAGRGYSFEVLRAKLLLNVKNHKAEWGGGMAAAKHSPMYETFQTYLREIPKFFGIPFWRLKPNGKLHLVNPYHFKRDH